MSDIVSETRVEGHANEGRPIIEDIEEVKGYFSGLWSDAEDCQKRLALQLGCSQYDPRLSVYTVVRNSAMNIHALVSFYDLFKSGRVQFNMPESTPNPIDLAYIKIKILRDTRLMFIDGLSAAEYSAKRTIMVKASAPIIKIILRKVKRPGQLDLESIVDLSYNNELIPVREYDHWNEIFDIRDCLLYNNSIADTTRKDDFSTPSIRMKKGQRIIISRDGYIDLTYNIIYLYAYLLRAFYGLTRH